MRMHRSASFVDLSQIEVDEDSCSGEREYVTYELYQERIHDTVYSQLGNIAKMPTKDRKTALEALFNDLTCEIADVVKENIELKTCGKYYQILADYYNCKQSKADQLIDYGQKELWDVKEYQLVCSLTLYQWIFAFSDTQKMFNLLLRGCNRIFWLDVENSTTTFRPVFKFIHHNVLLSTQYWKSGALRNFLLDYFALVSKFYFYYYPNFKQEKLIAFLTTTQTEFDYYYDQISLPKGHTKIHTLNMFMNEVIRNLKVIQQEHVILTYLSCCKRFVLCDAWVAILSDKENPNEGPENSGHAFSDRQVRKEIGELGL